MNNMKFFLTIILIFLSQSLFADYRVYYNKVNKNIQWVRGSISSLEKNPDYVVFNIRDSESLLRFPVNQLTVDIKNKKLVKKSSSEITKVKNNERKKEIRRQVRALRIQRLGAFQERAEGFDISKETATIRTKIQALKQEYQSIP